MGKDLKKVGAVLTVRKSIENCLIYVDEALGHIDVVTKSLSGQRMTDLDLAEHCLDTIASILKCCIEDLRKLKD